MAGTQETITMNMIEKQAKLGRELYEINSNVMSELFELGRKNVEQHFAVNRTFGEKLPEVREISTFFELQREYGETLWNNARNAVEAQGAILGEAFNDTREAVQSAFTVETKSESAKKPANKKTKAAA